MPPQIVIAAYRPREGGTEALLRLVATHVPTLRAHGLVTDRPPVLMQSFDDGTVLEIFEWSSGEAAAEAHDTPEVARIWEAMGEVAEFVALGALPEAASRFPHFRPLAAG
jgi:hypothetical protein